MIRDESKKCSVCEAEVDQGRHRVRMDMGIEDSVIDLACSMRVNGIKTGKLG